MWGTRKCGLEPRAVVRTSRSAHDKLEEEGVCGLLKMAGARAGAKVGAGVREAKSIGMSLG